MPKDEKTWNPYRWVRVSDEPVLRAAPNYHHRFDGLSGRIWCELEALTPLLIGDGRGGFVRRRADNKPYVPGTSLKGAIRSLAELIGNAAIPFPKCSVDAAHQAKQAASGSGTNFQLDIVARMFGYLDGSTAFSGLVRFGDASVVESTLPQKPLTPFKVSGGQPDPKHQPFYPDTKRRKLYHHHPDATTLTPPHAGIKAAQQRHVRPLPPGTTFRFTVDFQNLRDEELDLLLYCLALEDDVTVTLSPDALGRDAFGQDAQAAVTFNGNLRHKLGGCKPQGAGSCHIQLTKLLLRDDPAARYRGQATEREFVEDDLEREIRRRTAAYVQRLDRTMQELRAMLVYSEDDPRKSINYPTYGWFKGDGADRPLKPTV